MRNKSYLELTINSIIGEKTNLRGEFNIDGPLRIDGNFTGKVISRGKVYIGKTGNVDATIIAKTIVIGGAFKGEAFAEKAITVLKTGQINGRIYSCSVNMDDGVDFHGECKVLSREDIRELVTIKSKS